MGQHQTIREQARNNITAQLDRLRGVRDEIELKLHLASLEAKTQWQNELEPRFREVERKAVAAGESAHSLVEDANRRFGQFLESLKH